MQFLKRGGSFLKKRMLYILRLLFTKWAIFSFHMILWEFSKDARKSFYLHVFIYLYGFLLLDALLSKILSVWYNLNLRPCCQPGVDSDWISHQIYNSVKKKLEDFETEEQGIIFSLCVRCVGNWEQSTKSSSGRSIT